MIGQTVGSYEVFEFLGYGSTCTVYKARPTYSDVGCSPSPVALKIASKAQRDHEYTRNPFTKEFDLLVAMYAANPICFVRPLECSTTESVHFLATELMDETLDRWGERLRPMLVSGFTNHLAAAILSKLRSTIDILGTAHTLGYSIRDISPRNFLVKDDVVKAIDLSSAILITCDAGHPDTRVTPRYASSNVVAGGRAQYSDDYEALCYLWLDILTDRLAWRKCKKPSIIREIKLACLDTFTKHYGNLPPLFISMLRLARNNEGEHDSKDYHKTLIDLVDKLQPSDLARIVSDFKDNSSDFATYDGVF